MNSWFTVKVKYTKQLDDGTFKRVSEPYLLAAMTFTDAEARIYEELGSLIRGEFLVTGISRTDIHDIFHYEDSDVWFKCKINFESGDGGEEGGKAKKVSQNFLVSAHSVKEAYERLHESLGGMLIDFQIPNIAVSPIVDIFPFGDEGEDRVAVEFEKQVKKEVAEHVMGTKTVFSASGSDIDDLDEEEDESVIEDRSKKPTKKTNNMDKFLQQVRNDHREFDNGKLEDHVGNDPMPLFAQWLKEAIEKPVSEPNAMAVSTIGEDGFPQSRIVYMRELLDGGLVFYTNYDSSKGRAIALNPKVHALFFWPELERQISVYGHVEKVPEAMSDAYFASRPRGSQIGAWASRQSEKLESRALLEQRIEQLLDHYPTIVPRPPHWGGYVIKPVKIEFWQGRPSRLHDRIVFEQEEAGSWTVYRRNP